MTVDHIVPLWFTRRVYQLGITNVEILENAGMRFSDLTSDICSKCNYAKGGIILYSYPVVRRYMQSLSELIQRRVDVHLGPKRIAVVCKCIECEQVKKWEDRQKVTQEIQAVHSGGSSILSPRENYKELHA